MANKVDISEVTDFQSDLQEASTNFRSQLDKVIEHIEAVNGMSSFSGKAAKEAKQYFSELHVTLLESFKGLFDDLEANLEQHLEEFQSEVDVSETAIIQSDYLQDIQEDVNELYEDLVTQDETIHDTINDVSDISSATPPSFSEIDEYKKKTIKKLEEVDEDLASFTGKGDETDVEAIMSQIETAMNHAQTSEGQARFADFEGVSQSNDLRKLQEYNERKQEEQMEKAKDARDSVLRDKDKSSARDVVNKAYQEFEDGDISYDQYTAIVDSVKNTSGNMSEEKIKEHTTESFIEYLEDRGMLEAYLEEHEVVAKYEAIQATDQPSSEEVINMAYQDFENGEIDKETYINVLNELKNFDKEYKESNEDIEGIEVSQVLLNYIGSKENDIIDDTGELLKDGISVAPLFAAYGLHKKGFEIQKYKTEGKEMVRYRVYNPQAAGMSKPTKRDTKIYDKKFVDQQVKRGSSNKVPIADRVNVRAGATNGLKTKAGWLGVAIDTGVNIKGNIEDGESVERIVGDAGVDVGVGAVSLAAAGAAAAFTVGTLGAPVLAGAAAGFVISSGVSAVANIEVKGKSIKNHVKDGVQGVANSVKSGVETVAGWFK